METISETVPLLGEAPSETIRCGCFPWRAEEEAIDNEKVLIEKNEFFEQQTLNYEMTVNRLDPEPNKWTELNPKEKLRRLRKLMLKHEIGVYIVPSQDEHLCERTSIIDKRLEFISGFTGGTGVCVITLDDTKQLKGEAALSVDGRFFLQADTELDPDDWRLLKQDTVGYPTWQEYAIDKAKTNKFSNIIGCDPRFLSYKDGQYLEMNYKHFMTFNENLIDQVWDDEKPKLPDNPVYDYDTKYSGKSMELKLDHVREKLLTSGRDYVILSNLEEIAWLFNLRCDGDFEYTPFFKSYAIISIDKAILYMDVAKIQTKLQGIELLIIKPYHTIFEDLENLQTSNPIIVPKSCNYAIIKCLKSHKLEFDSFISYIKIYKNETELFNAKLAQYKDSLAFMIFFGWLENELLNKKTIINEYEAATKLFKIRSKFPNFKGHANPAICSSGPNSSIIIYKPTKDNNSLINPDNIFLLDSGAQYLEGTTDITRTYKFGYKNLLQEDKKFYTLVLKCHLAVSMAKFPSNENTSTLLDGYSRQPLWDLGMDFNHGTGHGIGSFGNIHEGPLYISTTKGPIKEDLFKKGGILTIEPGYYIDEVKGFRIENDVEIIETDLVDRHGNKLLGFNTLTKVPYCRKLIDPSYLTVDEINWINDYYKDIRSKCGPALLKMEEELAYDWLMKETESL